MGCALSVCLPSGLPADAADSAFDGFVSSPNVTPHTIQLVKQSWQQVLQQHTIGGEAVDHINRLRQNTSDGPSNGPATAGVPGSPSRMSPATQFYEYFYSFLFSHHSDSQQFFSDKNIRARANSLIRMITTAIDMASIPTCLAASKLMVIAEWHAEKGVTAYQFKPVIQALIHSLTLMLGPERFTPEVKEAWLHLYSKIMLIMAPTMTDKPIQTEETSTQGKVIRVQPKSPPGGDTPTHTLQ